MDVLELLKGEWREYSGGSRPATNRIRFVESHDGAVHIELRYVCDWNTGETQDLSFRLTREEFNRLAKQLFTAGYAAINKNDQGEALAFEWKLTPGGFAFRLKGVTTTLFDGSVGLELSDFHEVHCGRLTEI